MKKIALEQQDGLDENVVPFKPVVDNGEMDLPGTVRKILERMPPERLEAMIQSVRETLAQVESEKLPRRPRLDPYTAISGF